MTAVVSDTTRTAAVVQAEIDTVKADRVLSSGTIRAGHTRKLKALAAELATISTQCDRGPVSEAPIANVRNTGKGTAVAEIIEAGAKVKLSQLVEAIAADISASGVAIDQNSVGQLGDQVVAAGLLAFYTPARYSDGRWCSQAALQTIRKLVKVKAAG